MQSSMLPTVLFWAVVWTAAFIVHPWSKGQTVRQTQKSEVVVLLIYIYAFYIKKCYFSSATVRNQRNIVIVGGSNHEISLS